MKKLIVATQRLRAIQQKTINAKFNQIWGYNKSPAHLTDSDKDRASISELFGRLVKRSINMHSSYVVHCEAGAMASTAA